MPDSSFPSYLRHELLTQVNAIIGYSEMLLEEIAERGGSTTGWRTDLDKIRASGADLFRFLESTRTDTASAIFLAELLYFIRTLVTTIVGYADLLIEEASDQTLPETLHDLEIIRNAGHTLVAHLQAFIQIDETQACLENLGSAIAEVFPLMRNAVHAMQNRRNKSSRLLPGKLLVVDDDAISRDLLVHELQREGYQVATAEGGREALQMIRTQSYDLLILDIVMPEMNGYQVLEQLKSDGILIDLPVVIISAWIELDDIAHCIELGAEDYLPRKFNSALLKARVSASLEKKWLREQKLAWLQEKQNLEHSALLESEKKFRQLVSGALVGIFRTTLDGQVLDANPVMLQTLGYTSTTELNQVGIESIYVDPHDRQHLMEQLRQSPVRGFEVLVKRKSGEIFFAAFSAHFTEGSGEQLLEGTLEDITERKQIEMALRQSQEELHDAQRIAGVGSWQMDLVTNQVIWSEELYRMQGVSPQSTPPDYTDSAKLFTPESWERLSNALASTVESGIAYELELEMIKADGSHGWMLARGEVVRNLNNVVIGVRGVSVDITKRKQYEKHIEYIAYHDALTSLPNRVLLADRLHQGMTQNLRREQRLAVAYLDLDGFKAINDDYGHEIGDQLLITVARRMKQALREGDTLARIGGDEFVAILLDLTDFASCIPMLNRLLTAASQPVEVGDLVLKISASLGVTFYPQAINVDADQLLRQADQAMYQAKLTGKNRYFVFDAAHDTNIRDHHESLEQIRLAFIAHEFVLHYQPKVDIHSGKTIGAEALIRWQHAEKGLLPPCMFLPVIENQTLAVEIGEWVIDTALAQMECWRQIGLEIPVSVNVGAMQLQQEGFVESISKLLAAHPNIKPSNLEIEVLETSALEDVASVSKVMGQCRKIGVTFALDDFGTGYSSLTYLQRLPIDKIKIDKSFVRDMTTDQNDAILAQTIIGMGKNFHLNVIAEGVETEEQLILLKKFGCTTCQGYFFSKPLPAARFETFVNTGEYRYT
jgi:diguanylate cyclase (GGDEF)-like protein/PAS domain S-box-containing protein